MGVDLLSYSIDLMTDIWVIMQLYLLTEAEKV